jgi:hypothetical protein
MLLLLIYLVRPARTCKVTTHSKTSSLYASTKTKINPLVRKHTYGLIHIESQGRSFLLSAQEPKEARKKIKT